MNHDPRTGRIQLGATYRDRLTGFTGVAVGRYEYLTGCTRVCLACRDLAADGKILRNTFDAPMLEFVEISDDMKLIREDRRAAAAATDPAAAG